MMWLSPVLYKLFEWMNGFFSFGVTLLFHSTAIILLGLLLRFVVRKKGMAAQSVVLRTCLVAVLISPLIPVIYSMSGVETLNISLPVPGIESLNNLFRDKNIVQGTGAPAINESNAVTQQDGVQGVQRSTASGQDHSAPSNAVMGVDGSTTSSESQPIATNGFHDKILSLLSLAAIAALTGTWIFVSLLLLIKSVRDYRYIGKIIRSSAEIRPSDKETCISVAHDLGVTPPRAVKIRP